MGEVCSSDLSVHFYQNARCLIPEYVKFHVNLSPETSRLVSKQDPTLMRKRRTGDNSGYSVYDVPDLAVSQ